MRALLCRIAGHAPLWFVCVSSPAPDGGGAERVEPALDAGGLQQTHHAHVAVAEAEEREERNGAPHPHARGVENGEQEVYGERKLEGGEPAARAAVLLPLPRLILPRFNFVLRRPHKLGLD